MALIPLEIIKSRIDSVFSQAVEIRRYLHAHPELSGKEINTETYIKNKLKEWNIEHKGGIAGHGVIGTIYGKNKEQAVGIRADIDALPINEETGLPFQSIYPGIMHACGHDMHTAILLATAKVLKEFKDALPLSVRLIFQPSEETVGGALPMIEGGALKNPKTSHVLGLHVDPVIPSGYIKVTSGIMNAASCQFTVTLKGKGCHGAYPWLGKDTLLPGCSMITGLQSITTKKLPLGRDGLISVGSFTSGNRGNIIEGETTFSGIIRGFSSHTCSLLKQHLQTMCLGIASAYEVDCIFDFSDSYPVLENDSGIYEIFLQNMENAMEKDKIIKSSLPSFGTDDFAYFCHNSRGFYYNLGVKNPHSKEEIPLHSPRFAPDEEAIKTGILTEVIGALAIMEINI